MYDKNTPMHASTRWRSMVGSRFAGDMILRSVTTFAPIFNSKRIHVRLHLKDYAFQMGEQALSSACTLAYTLQVGTGQTLLPLNIYRLIDER